MYCWHQNAKLLIILNNALCVCLRSHLEPQGESKKGVSPKMPYGVPWGRCWPSTQGVSGK